MSASVFNFSVLKSKPLAADKNGAALAVSFPFIKDGKPLEEAPLCCLSLKAAGSMRFRWNEPNQVRENFFKSLGIDYSSVVAPELIHSKTVFCVDNADELAVFRALRSEGDAVLSANPAYVPAVTVADCVPIYLYDSKKRVAGMVHSGWKGTGIVKEAVERMVHFYKSEPSDICAVIGPHIKDCCYSVDAERAAFFSGKFCKDSAVEDGGVFKLDLLAANITLLLESGVKPCNIAAASECTCCTEELGSHRRETAGCPDNMPIEERSKLFTVMTAFLVCL
ncbi:MAG: polyphenol oxidase family protein [Spirochaetaceae bacterium]|nr:polyphenol oxidase family protein [Spirochaetaceae bacterium]